MISSRCREFQQRVLKPDTLSDVLDWAEQIATVGPKAEALRAKVNGR